MITSRVRTAALLSLALLSTAAPALAVTASGTLSAPYGPPLATQSTQSDVGGADDPYSSQNLAFGSQLVAAYAYVSDGALHIFLTGNQMFWFQLEGLITHWMPVDVFIDCAPGGQQQLLANNPTIDPTDYDMKKLAGLSFDNGFGADYWLSLGSSGSISSGWPNLQAYFATLPTAGGGTGTYLGQTLAGPPGTLSGGSNPSGIAVTLDDSNHSGVGNGCAASSLPAVQTGIEWAIPLEAIGNPTGCIRMCAFIASSDHALVSNQVMGPIPPGTCSLSPAGSVNFAAVPGDQFFSVCPSTPTHPSTWGALKTHYR